ncbi:GNAT family N-acetyltransferase [Neobacillus notoginsengisoli]|uniref:GNAT family N-acetyltransferase n=1 Tax=Neobacillus notoginsengisoli TaxID=1578198 RepID=A0A417YS61_9BACI|nr:GNAT family N-acetyltransferase [Neobacillus notoginsengisoli]RHW38138.1 GNAT family N-acetyltransferase [Neobacillus notoginsengisoli]
MKYSHTLDGITAEMLSGFFVGWPNPPSLETHLKLLQNSSHIVLAMDDVKVVGFITAISDGVLSAYIPFLEVLPEYQSKGIGNELVNKMLEQLRGIYMIDLCCDDNLVPYYEKFGMFKSNGMLFRNYDRQSGM